MSDNEPLPELLQADWSSEQVLALFADLANGAQVRHVQLRTDKEDRVATLAEAEASFAAGQVKAIQVRYLFEGELWCDTMIPGHGTTRIIRNRVPSLPDSI